MEKRNTLKWEVDEEDVRKEEFGTGRELRPEETKLYSGGCGKANDPGRPCKTYLPPKTNEKGDGEVRSECKRERRSAY